VESKKSINSPMATFIRGKGTEKLSVRFSEQIEEEKVPFI
jgi:hypothetical protein